MDQPNLLEWEPKPGARNSDPETSHAAADTAQMKASHGRLRVLQFLAADGPMTDHELAAVTGVIQTSIGKRRGECRDHGLVEAVLDNGTVASRLSPSGSRATVWQITKKGREFLAAQERVAA
jgi:hypothetical protein